MFFRFIVEGAAAVIDDIDVEEAIAVHIGDGERHASAFVRQTGGFRDFFEAALAIVLEEACAASDAVDDEVEIVVAIEVRERSASGGLTRAGGARGFGDALELPIA